MYWIELFVLCHFILTVAIALRVIYARRSSSAALAWLAVLFAFPYFGVLLYLLIGEPKLGRARAKRRAELLAFHDAFADRFLPPQALPPEDIRFRQIARLVQADTRFDTTTGNDTRLLADTDAILQSFIADIDAAQHCCLLEFYIVEGSGRVAGVLEALMRAAARGVRCQLLVDALGSQNFWRSAWPGKLRAAGVEVTEALPFGLIRALWVRSDLRNHRKILIVDNLIAYTGSFNLVDPRYFKQGAGVGEWVDVMMRCRGTVVLEMAAVFYADVAVEADEHLAEVRQEIEKLDDKIPELLALKRQSGTAVAQVIPSAPDQSDPVIYETIVCAIHAAKTRVTITTPYFVPDELLLTALTTAAKRGVDVVLILPEKVDSFLVRWASRAYYPKLLTAGVKIALFHGGLLHAKTLVVDGDYALFGTVNMDMRSFFLNLEISLAIYDAPVVREIARIQKTYLRDSRYISVKRWQKREKIWGLVENTVRLFSPLL